MSSGYYGSYEATPGEGATLAEQVWYGDSLGARCARTLLVPASALFGAGVAARSALYAAGWLPSERAELPVISVGGLRVGGAGKTPMVLWLAEQLRRHGKSVCLVTRGYGAKDPEASPFLLPAWPFGGAAAASVAEMVRRAGDEAALLSLRSGCPVVVGADRRAACRLAVQQLKARGAAPDLFLLDDGFQHRALARDFDLVMVSGSESSERLLPAGPLRERVGALDRADAVVTLRPAGGEATGASPTLSERSFGCEATVATSSLVEHVTDAAGESAGLERRRVVAVAGIARPERFLSGLTRAGAKVVAAVLRPDHHHYDEADLAEIRAAAEGADLVLTTEKDLVKLVGVRLGTPLRALRIELQLEAGDALISRILALPAFDR